MVAPDADPVDPLVASSSLALKMRFDKPVAVEKTLAAILPDASQSDGGPVGELVRGLDDLPDLVDDAARARSIDRSSPAYLAVTPQGNPQFLNGLQISSILPVEKDARWLHTRFVVDAKSERGEELRDEVERSVVGDDAETSSWRFRVIDDRVVADHLLALSPEIGAATEQDFDVLRHRPRLGERRTSAARARFADARSPVAMYVDYRRVGQLLSIVESGTRTGRVAAEIDDGGFSLFTRWVTDNTRAHEPFRLFERRPSDYADATVEFDATGGELAADVVTTRTDHGARGVEAMPDDSISLPEHPAREAMMHWEATAPPGDRRSEQRRVRRWLAADTGIGEEGTRREAYLDVAPWLLFSRPSSALAAWVGEDVTLPRARGLRVTVYRPHRGGEDGGGQRAVYPTAVTAFYGDSQDVATRIRRGLEQRDGLDWRLDSVDDGYILRAVRHLELDDALPDGAVERPVESLSITADTDGVETWRRREPSWGLDAFPGLIWDLFDGDLEVSSTPHPAYTELSIRVDGTPFAESDSSLPALPVSTYLAPPRCAVVTGVALDRLLAESRQASGPDRANQIMRRALPILDRARQCEGDNPRLPSFSRVLGRELWDLGIRSEREGELARAVGYFRQGCELDDGLSCRYLRRVRRASSVEVPVVSRSVRTPRPAGDFSGAVFAYLSVDDHGRVSVGDRAVGTTDELSTPEMRRRLEGELERTPVSTPLGVVEGHPDWRRRARSTRGVAAPGEVDVADLLGSLNATSANGGTKILAYLRDETGTSVTTLLNVRAGGAGLQAPGETSRTRLRLTGRGIDIFSGGRKIRPVDGCSRHGPTICGDQKASSDRSLPVERLLSVMPEVNNWRRGGPVTIVVDTDLEWGELTEVALLLQDPNHPAWDRPPSTRLGRLMPRFGTPGERIDVVVR